MVDWSRERGIFAALQPHDLSCGVATVFGEARAYAVIDHPVVGRRLAIEAAGTLLPFAGVSLYGWDGEWMDHSRLGSLELIDVLGQHQRALQYALASSEELSASAFRVSTVHARQGGMVNPYGRYANPSGYEIIGMNANGTADGHRTVLHCSRFSFGAVMSVNMTWFQY